LLATFFLFGTLAPRAHADITPSGGAPVSPSDSIQFDPVVVADGQGGAIVGWQDGRLGASPVPFAQHIDRSGHPLATWPDSGWGLPHPFRAQDHCVAISDGAGGAYMAEGARPWWGVVSIHRVPFDTSQVAPWPQDGVNIMGSIQNLTDQAPTSSADPARIEGIGPGAFLPDLAPDGQGGLLVAWSYMRLRGDANVLVLRIGADGRPAPGWSIYGVTLRPSYIDQWSLVLCGDGRGGAFVFFSDDFLGRRLPTG
jgi:hypothetical protein